VDFKELVDSVRVAKGTDPNRLKDQHVLCFDPGHTTGWAVFYNNELLESGEIQTKSQIDVLTNADPLYGRYKPTVVVMEDYRVYKWRKDHHVGSEMLTTQVIGGLELLAVQNWIYHIIKQPAQVAKGFCTDKKLKDWGFWQSGERHARDAIRHGCYYILFGSVQKKDKGGSVVG
jgi:hypothetical protein